MEIVRESVKGKERNRDPRRLEAGGEGARVEVADATGASSGYIIKTLDDYGASEYNEIFERVEPRKNGSNERRIASNEQLGVHRGQRNDVPQGHCAWCLSMVKSKKPYPCFICQGGTNYDRCTAIRAAKTCRRIK